MTSIVSKPLYARLSRQAARAAVIAVPHHRSLANPSLSSISSPVLSVAHLTKTISGFHAAAATSSRALRLKPQIQRPVYLFRCSIPDDSPGATTLSGLVMGCS